MTATAVAAFCVLGLILGSFANGVAYRVPRHIAWWRGRSVCPHCQHPLSPHELLPVFSWLWQRGRCRHCEQPIAGRYPIGELALALLYLWAALAFGWSGQLLLAVVLGFVFLVLFQIDVSHGVLPDSITIPAALVTVVAQLFLGMAWQSIAVGVVVGAGFFALQYLVSSGRWVGGGDIRLGALLGALLGWPAILVALLIAYWSGAIVGLWLLITKRAQLHSAVPLGPFLVAAGWVVWLTYPQLTTWYALWF